MEEVTEHARSSESNCDLLSDPLCQYNIVTLCGQSSLGVSGSFTAVLQAITELFKLLLVALPAALAAAPATPSDISIMQLLVPLMVAAAAPAHDAPQPALAALVLQLVPHLATGPSAAAFREALAALAPASMQRLQVCRHDCRTIDSRHKPSALIPVARQLQHQLPVFPSLVPDILQRKIIPIDDQVKPASPLYDLPNVGAQVSVVPFCQSLADLKKKASADYLCNVK